MPSHHHFSQQGVALITVLLIVALATTIATAMATRQQIDIRRSDNVFARTQAYHYALGEETWAKQILYRDVTTPDSDHLQEIWALQLPATPVEGGQLQGRLIDLQGRFNLNNLLNAEGEVSESDYAFLQRLLRRLELPERLADSAIDWIDSDLQPRTNGGEDNRYLLKQPAHRVANQHFFSLSELRFFPEVTPEIFQQLQPHLSVLPVRTAINVNTASKELLLALSDDLRDSDVEQLLVEREKDGFGSLQDFLRNDALAGIAIDGSGLDVGSKYFQLQAEAVISRAQIRLHSLLYRNRDESIETLWRAEVF